MKFHRWGIIAGPIAIVWMDAWSGRLGLEISAGRLVLVNVGFRE